MGYSMSAYPNPASNLLNIGIEELEQEAEAEAKDATAKEGLEQVKGQAGDQKTVVKAPPVYEIRLFNATGTLMLQTTSDGKTAKQLNVANLPNGIYTLHVSDGSGDPPQTRHIVISH
jgi:hypothetical protein